MSQEEQIEEMAKCKKCETCIHNAVCQELEEFRDPLGWISTEDEFVCSYYINSSEVAREIFEEIDILVDDWKHSRIQSIQFIAELAEIEKKYTEEEKGREQ